MSELDLLVLGDVNPDLLLSGVRDQPRFGQIEQLVESSTLTVGGSATITAVAAARLGLSSGVCGVVGSDHFGEFMTAAVRDSGVDCNRIRLSAHGTTGISVILAQALDRAILTAPGTIAELGADDLAALPDRVARHVHVASYFLMSDVYREALPAALRRFRSAGVSTSLDTNWDPDEMWQLDSVLDATDIFLPNAAELLAISGKSSLSEALLVVGSRCPCVVTKLGANGAVGWSEGVALSVAATKSAGFVDAVGAGDCFNAGYLTGLLRARSPSDCLRLAVATGTLSTRGRGGTSALPEINDAEAVMGDLAVTSGFAQPS